MSTNVNKRVATQVRIELARRGLRAVTLAKLLDVSPASISYRLNGHTAFTVAELDAIATEWKMPLADLIGEPSASTAAA